MTEIIVPKPEKDKDGNPYPTLGPQICDFMEERFTYGPGPLRGEPYVVRRDFRYIIYRAYEHFPNGFMFNYDGEIVDMSGRRHFNQVNISLPKGMAKCVSPDTLFLSETGSEIRADQLQPGEVVQSYQDGKVVWRKVVATEVQPEALTYRVVPSRGREIRVSQGHRFLTRRGGVDIWVKAEDLTREDRLVAASPHGEVSLVGLFLVSPVGMTQTVGVEIEDTHVHVTNGLVTHNTEIMAVLACVEVHPDAPIRFNGYDPNAPGGMAPGRPVVSPFIPLLAPTLEQLGDLAYGAAMTIAGDADPEKQIYDVTKERIMLIGESESKIVPVAANAGRLDGLKPTFQGIDEPHRLHEDRHRAAYKTMVNNLPKRYADDAWQLTCTTAGDPSEPSIARDQYRMGVKMAEGKIEDPRSFFYHRGTSDENAKFTTMGERLRALKEASGPEMAQMRDLTTVAAMWDNEEHDKSYLERVWCNRWVQSSETAFDVKAFEALGDPDLIIPKGSLVTLGFDGAVTQDSTALVMTDVKTGVQQLVGLWERPVGVTSWQVPIAEVHSVVEACFEDYSVWRLYYDPPYWQEAGNIWASRWEGKVIEWPTRTINNMYYALRDYSEAIGLGDLAHDGNPDFVRHIGNAGKNELNITDDEGKKKYRLAKLNRDRKFDAAMAAVLSWKARLDAIKMGAKAETGLLEIPVRLH